MSNKDIKPCMNDGCGMWGERFSNGLNCGMNKRKPTICPKYTDAPPPKPFTPKNPDNYIPGCRNTLCAQHCWALLGKCSMIAEGAKNNTTIHNKLCCMTCYDPAPKPKTRQVAVWRIPLQEGEDGTAITVDEVEGHHGKMWMHTRKPHTVKFNNGITCEIITEEIEDD